MTRNEAYAKIKELGIQEEVQKVSGKNFTQTSTAILIQIIRKQEELKAAAVTKEEADNAKPVEKKETAKVSTASNALEAACLTFLGILKDNGLLDNMLAKL